MRDILCYASCLSCVFLSSSALADSYTDARNAAWEAFYKYEGWDKDFSQYSQKYADKYDKMLTKSQKDILGIVYIVARAVSEKQVTFTWRFP